ncbi:MAG: hypothetical protein QOF16_1100, partial [Actinomycetota bacterium]|nr:hypothetical protein [Actinomycetota bacterium]
MKTTSLIRRAPAVVVALLLVAGLAGPASAKTPVIAPPGGLAAHVS